MTPPLWNTARLGPIVLAIGLLALAVYVGSVIVVINSPDYEADSYLIDFTAFWGAAKLALQGEAVAAFDPARLAGVQGARALGKMNEMPWFYPPGYHALITPLGLLPFSAAWIAFGAISAALFTTVLRPLTHGAPGALALVLAAPAVLLSLAIGNNGVLSAACMIAAIVALGNGNQRSAGLLIALMTLKPSLGLLVPPVLLAARQWGAILWATGGTLALAAASAALFGVEYWLRFLDQLSVASAMLAEGRLPFERMITWYGFIRSTGLDHAPALAAQVAATTLVVVAVGALWTRRATPFDAKAAAFFLGLTLATPYAYFYEMTFALAGIVFLLRAQSRWPTPAWILFALIWLVPALGLGLTSEFAPVALLAAPLQSLALGLALWSGFQSGRLPRTPKDTA